MSEKPIYDADKPCPHCGKPVHIKIKREVIKKAIPGEMKIIAFIEKGSQTTLVKK